MVIIWGSRWYFRAGKTTTSMFCTQCGDFGKLKSYHGSHFFHLYYIPLIPLALRARVHQMCPSCKQLTQFDTTDFESATQSSIESLADTVAALLDGDSTRSVDLDEEGNLCVDGAVPAHTIESSCLEEVQSHFAFLHAAGEDELIRQVVQRFEKPEYEYVFAVCNALAQGYQGKIDDSIAAWRRALAKVPDSEFATRRLAAALAMRKQYSESVEVYRKLMDMIDNRDAQFEILQYINELQLFGKLFADAVASYEQMIEFQPSLAENKAFMKQVDKARKKAGLMKAA